ncbi:hypothetical protein B0H14DRAFT_3458789 [Mycena olivaceomarginata]|nr:hypothetical protein B0H14DRAFT_3458789 [Mycena olivaceomarginata]
MHIISSIYAYCALVWAVSAAPAPVPQQSVPSDSIEQKHPIIHETDVFQPINVLRAVEIEMEKREHGDDNDIVAYCIIA